MSHLTIVSPSPALPVPAGTLGEIHVVFEPGSILAIAGTMTVAIRDNMGREVWANQTPVANNQAYLDCVWPAPGDYQIEATALGVVMGTLAMAVQNFTVVAPKMLAGGTDGPIATDDSAATVPDVPTIQGRRYIPAPAPLPPVRYGLISPSALQSLWNGILAVGARVIGLMAKRPGA